MVAKGAGRPRLHTNCTDICKFVTEAAHKGQTFFNSTGDLGTDQKFEKVRNWSNMLEIKDYVLSALADM
jgi:hypothetical protein